MTEITGKGDWYWGTYERPVMRLRMDDDGPQVSWTGVETEIPKALVVLREWLELARTRSPSHDIWVTIRIPEDDFRLENEYRNA